MAEPKPIASLSAGLLARKGAARPAMRRQAQLPGSHLSGHDDLGWNDMGYDVDPGIGAEDIGRTVSQGLSPMPAVHHTGFAAQPANHSAPAAMRSDALDALDAAADSAIESLHSHAPAVPHAAPVPEVRLQQERIAVELSPEVPVAAAPVDVAPVPVETPAEALIETPVSVAKAAPRAAPKATPRAHPGGRGNFAFTLRLDPARHLRLRLATAASNRSAQQILISLLDDYLSTLPEIDAFATGLPAAKSGR